MQMQKQTQQKQRWDFRDTHKGRLHFWISCLFPNCFQTIQQIHEYPFLHCSSQSFLLLVFSPMRFLGLGLGLGLHILLLFMNEKAQVQVQQQQLWEERLRFIQYHCWVFWQEIRDSNKWRSGERSSELGSV